MNDKIKRKVGSWIIKLVVCILFYSAGYLCNNNAGKYEYSYYTHPTVPKLPKNAPTIFHEYDFYDLNMAGAKRNKFLYDFYEAWKNEETYGFYEVGSGIDDLLHLYWLTQNGKVFQLMISDHGTFTIPITCHLNELDSLSFFAYKDTNGDSIRVPVDPNTLKNQAVYIDSKFAKRKQIIID